jgi:hypothetical protein
VVICPCVAHDKRSLVKERPAGTASRARVARLGFPPEQPRHDGAAELARTMLATVVFVVLVVPVARPDPSEEDVRWAVLGLRRREREGGGEPVTEPS